MPADMHDELRRRYEQEVRGRTPGTLAWRNEQERMFPVSFSVTTVAVLAVVIALVVISGGSHVDIVKLLLRRA